MKVAVSLPRSGEPLPSASEQLSAGSPASASEFRSTGASDAVDMAEPSLDPSGVRCSPALLGAEPGALQRVAEAGNST